MVNVRHVVLGIVIGILLSIVFVFGQDTKSRGKVWIHVVRQEKNEVLAQAVLPPTFAFRLDNGTLNGMKNFECEQWTITKESNGFKYPAFELHCGVIALSLTGIDMTQPEQTNEVR